MSQRTALSILLVLLVLLPLLAAGCSENGGNGQESGKKATALTGVAEPAEIIETLGEDELVVMVPPLVLTKSEERGLMIFRHYCAHCHGDYGLGDGQNSFGLEPPPRDLLQLELDGTHNDEDLRQVIRDGGAAHGFSSLMPPWGHTFDPERINDLVALIHILPELEEPEEGMEIFSLDDENVDDFSL